MIYLYYDYKIKVTKFETYEIFYFESTVSKMIPNLVIQM